MMCASVKDLRDSRHAAFAPSVSAGEAATFQSLGEAGPFT